MRNPPTVHAAIAEAEAAYKAAVELRGDVLTEIARRNLAEYVAAGGCAHCRGTGEVGYFDTYYPCVGASGKGCTSVGRYAGDGPQHDADKRALADAEENLHVAQAALDSAKRLHSLDVGMTVKVVRGRKVPIGTVGVVTGLYDGQWGTRVGIRVDGQPKPVYTSVANVATLSVSFDGEHMLPDLYGSPKQIAWARRIRETAIRSGRMTVEQARAIVYSRTWIDNRPSESRAA